MSKESTEKNSRIQELILEYFNLRDHLDQAIKDKNDPKIEEIKAQQNSLLLEIRAVDPDFEKEVV